MSGFCVGCELEAKVQCGACHKIGVEVHYCGAKCQRTLWKVHRHYCGKPAGIFYQPPLEKYEVSITLLSRTMQLPKNTVNLLRDEILAAGSEYFKGNNRLITPLISKLPVKHLDSELATQNWEAYQQHISQMEPSLVQTEIAFHRRTVSNFYRARDGQLGSYKSYPYSPYGMMVVMPNSLTEKEVPRWRAVMSDFNWACLNYATVEDELQSKDPALVDGLTALTLWRRMRAASKAVTAAGEGRYNATWDEQDKYRIAILGKE